MASAIKGFLRSRALVLLGAAAIVGAGRSAVADTLPLAYFTVGSFDVTGATGTSNNVAATFGAVTNGLGTTLTITGGGGTTTLSFTNASVSTSLFSPFSPIPFDGVGSLGNFNLASNATLMTITSPLSPKLTIDIFQTVPLASGATSPQLVGTIKGSVFFNNGEGSLIAVVVTPTSTVANSTPPVTYTPEGRVVPGGTATAIPITTLINGPTSLQADISAPNDPAGSTPTPLPDIASMGMTMLGLLVCGLAGHKLARRAPAA